MIAEREIIDKIEDEYIIALTKFPRFNSAHEGYAVIKEEVDELWDEIKKSQRPLEMKEEAIQIAAMALRFIIDVCDKK